MKNLDFIISTGDSVFNNQMSTSTLKDVINKINSDQNLAELINKLRSIQDKDQRKKFKTAHLPFFNLGQFQDNKRLTQNFLSSEFMIIDLDNLSETELDEVKNKLSNDQRVFIYFLSPSGNGFKVVYQFSKAVTNSDKFSDNYKYYAQQFEKEYGIKTDHTSDSARACFYSYDPDLFINENVVKLEVTDSFPETTKLDFSSIKTDDERFIPEAVEFLRTRINNYEDWTRAGMALASLGEKGRSYFQDLSNNPLYKDKSQVVDKKFDNFLKTSTGKIQIATLFEISKKYGFTYSSQAQPQEARIDLDEFLEEMKKQFEEDDKREIGRLLGFGLNEFSEIANNLDGVQPGFYHLAADTNIGKTAVYTNLVIDMLDSNDDLKVLFFALDDSKKYAAYRFLSILSELRFKDVKYGVNNLKDPFDKKALTKAREKLIEYIADKRLIISDISDIQHIDQVEDIIQQTERENIVVIIDGLYNLEVSDSSKEGIRQENIERAQKIKRLVDVYHIPVFTTGEFRKKTKGEGPNKKPTIDDLMETGKFGYNANVVWLLYPENQSKKNDPEVNLILEYAKNKISEFKGKQELTFIRGRGKIKQGWSEFSIKTSSSTLENPEGTTPVADLVGEELD